MYSSFIRDNFSPFFDIAYGSFVYKEIVPKNKNLNFFGTINKKVIKNEISYEYKIQGSGERNRTSFIMLR